MSGVSHHMHFTQKKISKALHCEVASSEGWDGEQETIPLVQTAALPPGDNMRLQDERRKGQMKHEEAIKNRECQSNLLYFDN